MEPTDEVKSKKAMMTGAVLFAPDGRYQEVDASSYKTAVEQYGVQGSPIVPYLDHIFGAHEEAEDRGAQAFTQNFTSMARQRKVLDTKTAVAGHFFYLPQGRLIFDLLLDYLDRNSLEYGFVKMDMPPVFTRDDKANAELTEKFMTGGGGPHGERMVGLTDGSFLRYAGDPVIFPWVAAKSPLTERDMPLRIFTPTLNFRHEKGGELRGLERSISFTITDYHSFADPKRDLEEYRHIHAMNSEVMRKFCGNDWFLNLDVESEFFEENKDKIADAVKIAEVASVAKLMGAKTHYYSIQNQYRVLLSDGSTTQVANLQFDRTNGRRFGIELRREDSTRDYATIVHGAQYGRVEKMLTFLMDRAANDIKQKKPPSFPLWLSPTQVRLIPLKDNHREYALRLLSDLKGADIRADIDPRKGDFRKRVQRASEDWVPYILVVGEKEMQGRLNVKDRKTENVTEMSSDEFMQKVRAEQEGMPFRPLPYSEDVSKRPLFF